MSRPSKTWGEIAADAPKIEAKGKIGFGLPLGPEEAQDETLLWFLGNGGGYRTADGKWVIDSQQNVQTLEFMAKLVTAGDTEPNPGTKKRADLFNEFAQRQIGMVNGEVALLAIINSARAQERRSRYHGYRRPNRADRQDARRL